VHDESARTVADLTRSLAPALPEVGALTAATLRSLADREDLADLLHVSVAGGTTGDRTAGSAWLSPRFGGPVDVDRVLVCNGTQGALTVLLRRLFATGGALATEALTYGIVPALARHLGIELRGVAIDDDGIVPEDLDRVCRASRPKALYCNPTLHNPTTAVMSRERRTAVADVARRHGLVVIEDDVLGRLHENGPPPLATLAPGTSVWYVMGLTKSLAHGLRMGYVVAPSVAAASALIDDAGRLSYWFASPLSAAIVRAWVGNRTADRLCAAIRGEAVVRQRIAQAILPPEFVISKPDSPHLWLRLPPQWAPPTFVEAAAERGVHVRASTMFLADERTSAPDAVRLSLSSAPDRASLEQALSILDGLLHRRRHRLADRAGTAGRRSVGEC